MIADRILGAALIALGALSAVSAMQLEVPFAADPLGPCSVFATGRSIVDPRDWPRPSEHFENAFQLADADGVLRTVPLAEWDQRNRLHDVCYVNGACDPHAVPSLARAGWAGVFMSGGEVVATAFAPVSQPSTQS